MAHREQSEYVAGVRLQYPHHFFNCTVLEIGSLNINGTVRDYFTGCNYIGIDLGGGPCVDMVIHAADMPSKYDRSFQTIITCEALEHDRHWQKTLVRAAQMLDSKGILIGTCAGRYRPEHGTKTCHPGSSPFTLDYYGNISPAHLSNVLSECFEEFEMTVSLNDVYFIARRPLENNVL